MVDRDTPDRASDRTNQLPFIQRPLQLRWTATSLSENTRQSGFIQSDTPDSITSLTNVEGAECVSVRNPVGAPWLYLKLQAGPELFNIPIVVHVRALTKSSRNLWIEYDSPDPDVLVVVDAPGAFKRTPRSITEAGVWMDHEFRIPDLQYTKRINGLDFRVVCSEAAGEEFFIQAVNGRLEIREDGSMPDSRLEESINSLAESIVFNEEKHPRVSIIVPFLNKKLFTQQFLINLQQHTCDGYEVILVDDGSEPDEVEAFSEIPGIRLISNQCNLGYARSCNRGAAVARAPILIFLNNDTIPRQGWLEELVSCLERNPNAGVLGAKLLYPDSDLIQHAGVLFDSFGLPYHKHRYHRADSSSVNRESIIPAVTGACMLTTASLFRALGGFDEQFLNGFEDTDYCLRVQAAGRDVVYCPESELLHYESISDERLKPQQEQANLAAFRGKWGGTLSWYTSGRDRLQKLTTTKRLGSEHGPSHALEFLDSQHTGGEKDSTFRFFSRVNLVLEDLIRAYFQTRDGQIQNAISTMQRSPDNFADEDEKELFRELFLEEDENPNERLFDSVVTNRAVPNRLPRVAVYTALIGNYDRLPPVISRSDCADFICFTDQPVAPGGWRVRSVERTTSSDVLEAKRYKVLPWAYLKEYQFSIYVDANTQLLGNLDNLIGRYLLFNDFVAWGHPERSDVISECFAILANKRCQVGPLFEQIKSYLERNMASYTGLVEASFLWRNHENEHVRNLMEAWWQHIGRFTHRDQVSLGYLMGSEHARPRILPARLGSSRANPWFRKILHRHEWTSQPIPRLPKQRPAKCVFVYNEKHRTTASTVLRCFQAVDVLHRLRPSLAATATSTLDMYGCIVILSKGTLKEITVDQLWRLHRNGNTILADFVDDPVDPYIVPHIDGLVASSISAYIDYSKKYAGTEVVHLTHCVDTRLRSLAKQHEFRIGYFGELKNTVASDRIKEHVNFHGVDTQRGDIDWTHKLHRYSCHYIARKRDNPESFKPFLKGFTAAHCGSPVIVDRDNPEVDYYLGPDYPLRVRADCEQDILTGIEKAKDSFGSSQWSNLVDRMHDARERSSPQWYTHEFDFLMRLFS